MDVLAFRRGVLWALNNREPVSRSLEKLSLRRLPETKAGQLAPQQNPRRRDEYQRETKQGGEAKGPLPHHQFDNHREYDLRERHNGNLGRRAGRKSSGKEDLTDRRR